MRELLELFLVFSKIGGFTFGGGYAMLPIIQKEIVEKKGWATDEEVVDYYAIGQITPGIIAVNTATFVGYKNKGILGAIFATLGMIFPSLIIIMIIASSFMHFQDNSIVQYAFAGLRVGVVVLVINAIIRFWKTSIKNILGAIICIATFLIIGFTKLSPIYISISAAILGIVFSFRKEDK